MVVVSGGAGMLRGFIPDEDARILPPPAGRLARGYIRQARQAMADLGGGLHDPPAVARCLAAAEALLSGDATGQWTMPGSLPSSSIYQVQGQTIHKQV